MLIELMSGYIRVSSDINALMLNWKTIAYILNWYLGLLLCLHAFLIVVVLWG